MVKYTVLFCSNLQGFITFKLPMALKPVRTYPLIWSQGGQLNSINTWCHRGQEHTFYFLTYPLIHSILWPQTSWTDPANNMGS